MARRIPRGFRVLGGFRVSGSGSVALTQRFYADFGFPQGLGTVPLRAAIRIPVRIASSHLLPLRLLIFLSWHPKPWSFLNPKP